jgi:hypothetical protein
MAFPGAPASPAAGIRATEPEISLVPVRIDTLDYEYDWLFVDRQQAVFQAFQPLPDVSAGQPCRRLVSISLRGLASDVHATLKMSAFLDDDARRLDIAGERGVFADLDFVLGIDVALHSA